MYLEREIFFFALNTLLRQRQLPCRATFSPSPSNGDADDEGDKAGSEDEVMEEESEKEIKP